MARWAAILGAVALLAVRVASATPRPAKRTSSGRPAARKSSPAKMRRLDWDTYLDKVQGAWMGKMIGVTFGAPWEFRRSEEHTSELQSLAYLVCRLLLEKKKKKNMSTKSFSKTSE